MRYLIMLAVLFGFAVNAESAIVTKTVEYSEGNTVLEGYLAYDDASPLYRPGILVVHEWTGINPYIMKRTEALARLGYVVFAADIYGKGVRPGTREEASKTSAYYKANIPLLRARVNAGLETLKKQPFVDYMNLAAIGYCFGGTSVLELARSGARVNGIVSFHGGLGTPNRKDALNIKGKVLALHGADDPFVKPDEVAAFQDEMRKAKVDWQFVSYGGAVHSFTNPDAGNDNSKGAAYNERADKRSWDTMVRFLREALRQ